MFPSHLFPAHFSLPILPVKSSHWRLFRKKLLHTEVLRYFPAHLSLPTFSYTFSLFRLFPSPLFPIHIPCQKQSVASDSRESPPLLRLCVSLPSSSLPTVPYPLSLFRLFPCPPFIPDDLILLIQVVTVAVNRTVRLCLMHSLCPTPLAPVFIFHAKLCPTFWLG